MSEVRGSDLVLEVGAGFGTLTRALAGRVERVVAVEFDRSLVPVLDEVLRGVHNVEVVQGDALKLDYEKLLGSQRFRLISNLPYNIATPLIADLLQGVPQINDLLVLVQKEVGNRLVAPPGSKDYGAVSVLVSYHCDSRLLGRVPATVFWPVPKVDSVLVRMTRRQTEDLIGPQRLMEVVRAGFAQRRKTLRNSLAASLDRPTTEIEAALAEAGITASRRPEELSLDEFLRLAEKLG